MKSIADQSRDDASEEVLRLSPSERIALALRLGEQAVETFASAHGITRDEARRRLRRNSQVGRRFSAAASFEDQ